MSMFMAMLMSILILLWNCDLDDHYVLYGGILQAVESCVLLVWSAYYHSFARSSVIRHGDPQQFATLLFMFII